MLGLRNMQKSSELTKENFEETSSFVPVTDTGLESMTKELSRHGEVALFYHGNGWHCTCELWVSKRTEGVKFKVSSEFRQETASVSVEQCLARVLEAKSYHTSEES